MTSESFNDSASEVALTAEAARDQRQAVERMVSTREATAAIRWALVLLGFCSLAAFVSSWFRLAVQWGVGFTPESLIFMGTHSSVFIATIWSAIVAQRHWHAVGFRAVVPFCLAFGVIMFWAYVPYENGYLHGYDVGRQRDYDEVVRLVGSGKIGLDHDGYAMVPARFGRLSITGAVSCRQGEGSKEVDFTVSDRDPQLHYVFSSTGEFVGPGDSSGFWVTSVIKKNQHWFLAVYQGLSDFD